MNSKLFRDGNDNTFLMAVCLMNNELFALKLLDLHEKGIEDCELEHVNKKSQTALIIACQNKLSNVALKIIELLDSKSSSINIICSISKHTALFEACAYKLESVMLAIMDKFDGGRNLSYYRSYTYSHNSFFNQLISINSQNVILKLIDDNLNDKFLFDFNKISNILICLCNCGFGQCANKLIELHETGKYDCKFNNVNSNDLFSAISRYKLESTFEKVYPYIKPFGNTFEYLCKNKFYNTIRFVLNNKIIVEWNTSNLSLAIQYNVPVEICLEILNMRHQLPCTIDNVLFIKACNHTDENILLKLIELLETNEIQNTSELYHSIFSQMAKSKKYNSMLKILDIIEKQQKISILMEYDFMSSVIESSNMEIFDKFVILSDINIKIQNYKNYDTFFATACQYSEDIGLKLIQMYEPEINISNNILYIASINKFDKLINYILNKLVDSNMIYFEDKQGLCALDKICHHKLIQFENKINDLTNINRDKLNLNDITLRRLCKCLCESHMKKLFENLICSIKNLNFVLKQQILINNCSMSIIEYILKNNMFDLQIKLIKQDPTILLDNMNLLLKNEYIVKLIKELNDKSIYDVLKNYITQYCVCFKNKNTLFTTLNVSIEQLVNLCLEIIPEQFTTKIKQECFFCCEDECETLYMIKLCKHIFRSHEECMQKIEDNICPICRESFDYDDDIVQVYLC
jgi:hypothetical protein